MKIHKKMFNWGKTVIGNTLLPVILIGSLFCAIPASAAPFGTTGVLPNVITSDEGDSGNPSDANAAVGPDRIIATTNHGLAILDKTTGMRINFYTPSDFISLIPSTLSGGVGDPIMEYDESSQRFIGLLWETVGLLNNATMTITAPGSLAGTYPASKGVNTGSQQPFDLSGIGIVKAVPFNADIPLTNASEMAGKIALIDSDGYATPSSNKGDNAAAAGAVGVIIISGAGSLDSIFGSNIIPSVSISRDIGLALAAEPTVVGGIKSLSSTEVGVGGYSIMHVSVSKNSSPNSKADFYHYQVGGPGPAGVYNEIYADYPKVGIDQDSIYITNWALKYPVRVSDNAQTLTSQIVAVKKAPLLSGGAVEVLLNNHVLINPTVTDDFWGTVANQLRFPTYHRPSDVSRPQVQFAVNLILDKNAIENNQASGRQLKVTAIKNILGTPTLQEFIINVNPWKAVGFEKINGLRRPVDTAKQPLDPFGLKPRLEVSTALPMYRCVEYRNSLWCTMSTNEGVGSKKSHQVRWYEIDISKIFNTTPRVSLKQEGIIALGNGTSAVYPSIDVDKDENMAVGFNIVGPNQAIALAHTGRFKTDPRGTTRLPIKVDLEGPFDMPFILDFTKPPFAGRQRWGDYSSLTLDPNGETFWYFSQYHVADPVRYFAEVPQWSTGMVSFEANP